MRILSFFCFLAVVPFLVGCQSDRSENSTTANTAPPTLETALPGTWETVSLQVKINSVDNVSDSTGIFAVDEENWVNTFGIKPSRIFFEPDNQYRTEYRTLGDSLTSQFRGMWNVFGDTLMMVEPEVTYQYYVSIHSGLATFQSGIDWDGDGWEDDEYTEVRRKISAGTE